MADLDPLIRYHKHGVEEKQRALSELYAVAEKLDAQKKALLDEMEHEKKLAQESNSPDTAAFLGKYLDNARKKADSIDDRRHDLEARINVAQEDMRAAFAELKKIEITQRKRTAAERAEEQEKEDRELDEIALESYRRKLDEE